MKQTLQLKLGQHLTMTPQLQQAIRLLQLSTLDLTQEIQEALETNPLLDIEDEIQHQPENSQYETNNKDSLETADRSNNDNDLNNEREIQTDSPSLSDELPTDSEWSDVYDSYLPSASRSTDDTDTDFLLHRGDNSETLQEHLIWQMNLTPFSAIDREIATAIIDGISEDGYFTGDLNEISASLQEHEVEIEDVEAVLHRIQAFDPPGVGATDTRDCLLLQLYQLDEDTPFREEAIDLCRDFFKYLASQDQAQIKRRMRIDDATLTGITQLIRSLNPRPGSLIESNHAQYVVPDVFVSKHNNRWHVELNPDTTPKLQINREYANLIRRADQSADNTFLKNHLQEARWFIKSLVSRNETILRVATKIVEYQTGFLEYGEEAMRPLVLKDIAEPLEMHESTISRVTTQKYMYTPRGTYEFKYFFSSHVSTSSGGECSSTAIRALIKKLVAAELPNKPLSDNKIAAILSEQGIKVARRTVAKYRESMNIPPSNERKRLV